MNAQTTTCTICNGAGAVPIGHPDMELLAECESCAGQGIVEISK